MSSIHCIKIFYSVTSSRRSYRKQKRNIPTVKNLFWCNLKTRVISKASHLIFLTFIYRYPTIIPFSISHFFQNVSVSSSDKIVEPWSVTHLPNERPVIFFHKNTMFPPHNIHVRPPFCLISSFIFLFFLLAMKKISFNYDTRMNVMEVGIVRYMKIVLLIIVLGAYLPVGVNTQTTVSHLKPHKLLHSLKVLRGKSMPFLAKKNFLIDSEMPSFVTIFQLYFFYSYCLIYNLYSISLFFFF